jgi:hypothetical protein
MLNNPCDSAVVGESAGAKNRSSGQFFCGLLYALRAESGRVTLLRGAHNSFLAENNYIVTHGQVDLAATFNEL